MTPSTGLRRFGGALATVALTLALAAGAMIAATTSAAADETPAAPTTSAPPQAHVYQPYSHQITNLGTPAPTITLYRDSGSGPVAQTPSAGIYTLNNGLKFDTATGVITRPLTAGDFPTPEPDLFTLVLNNGLGGAATAQPATDTAPALAEHDVMIQFRIPVLFSDVPTTHQFADEIYRMANAAVTTGNATGAFQPTANVTRQVFASFAVKYLNRAAADLGVTFASFGLSTPLKTGSCTPHSVTSPFVDVAESSPFCMEIQQLNAMGVVGGFNEFSFQPAANITRQALSGMMYRTHLVANGFADPAQIGTNLPCTGASGFSDVKPSNTFCGQIQWMNANGISTGYVGGTYRPAATSTRQVTITFMDRMGAVDGLSGFGA